MPDVERVWVVNGEGGRFAGAVFSTLDKAEAWIKLHSITGVATAYPLDIGVYDWALGAGYFREKHPSTPRFIGGFSSSYQDHHHYEAGERTA